MPSLRFFDGNHKPTSRVALGGASKSADKPDRAALVEQARADRERRGRLRAETRSATTVQARPRAQIRASTNVLRIVTRTSPNAIVLYTGPHTTALAW